MADDDDNSGLIFFLCCCTVLPCTVLQGVGYFTPFWIVDDSCDTIGTNRCCDYNGTEGCTPLKHVYLTPKFEATAFSFFLISTLCSIISICCSGNKTCTDASQCIFVVLYGLAGGFSVSGCILIGMDYPSTSWGYSFYLCLVAGSYNCVQVICTCGLLCCACCEGCKEEDEEESSQTAVDLDNIGGQTDTVATTQDTGIAEDPIATTGHIDTFWDGTATPQETYTNDVGINFNEAEFVIPTISQTVNEEISIDFVS